MWRCLLVSVFGNRHPERLHFHLVLPPSHRFRANHLSAFFRDVKIDIVRYCIWKSTLTWDTCFSRLCLLGLFEVIPSLEVDSNSLFRSVADIVLKSWICVTVNSEKIDLKEMEKHITFRNNSKARPELQSVYNFVPFLLPRYFKDVGRFIYLDADTVVKVYKSFSNFLAHLFLLSP